MEFSPIKFDSELCPGGILAGVDEAGRGPLAGSVVAACVIFGKSIPDGLTDSKLLTPQKREHLYTQIIDQAHSFGIGEASPQEIDEINILQATFLAMRRAVGQLTVLPNLILIDGNHTVPKLHFPQKCIVKGDQKSACIAAASILAKVTRDRQMEELSEKYPEYLFHIHKGYGTKKHLEALEKFGFSPIHRRSFKPKSLLQTDLFA